MEASRSSTAKSRRSPGRTFARGLLPLLLPLLALAIASALHAQEVPPGDAQILFSELFPEPLEPQIGVGDWIELANAGVDTVNLRGWTLHTGNGLSITIVGDLWMEPGAYAVIAQRSETEDLSGVPVSYADDALLLAAQGTLALRTPDGRLVDFFDWSAAPSIAQGRSLERTALHAGAAWQAAWEQWPRGGGAYGSPGRRWQPPPTPVPPPIVLISEYLADPAAVSDDLGEWVELHNPNDYAVDLAGWSLGDTSGQRVGLDGLTLAPLAYLVLGRSADSAVNGGVAVAGGLGSLQLANRDDVIEVHAPDGTLVDWAAWIEGNGVVEGRSRERMSLGTNRDQVWRSAVSPWPGSAGDWGSPGLPPPEAPATPTPTPTSLPPPPLPEVWPLVDAPPPLQIEEVSYRGDDEYVVLVNRSAEPLSLAGWMVGDAQDPRGGEALHLLPQEAQIPAGGGYVIARDGASFASRWMAAADAQFEPTAEGVPTLIPHPAFSAAFSLDDGGDEVLLFSPDLRIADAVAFGNHQGVAAGVEGALAAPEGMSLQRAGDLPWPTVRDVRQRFVVTEPNPLLPLALPPPAHGREFLLTDGLRALWGVAAAATNFTTGESLSPFAALSLASAHGLDFVALGDARPHTALPFALPATLLPTWAWSHGDDRALVVGQHMAGLDDEGGLLAWLYTSGTDAIWLGSGAPPSAVFLGGWAGPWPPANPAAAPDPLLQGWRDAEAPFLPVRAGRLALGESTPSAILGLAAASAEPGPLLEALHARRGWLSTSPGLWLALTAATPQRNVWMGGEVDAANHLALTLFAGERDHRALTVTLWQDETALASWQSAGGEPRTVTVLARPGAFFYATAHGAGGRYAVTAPLRVRSNPEATVILNEILADPEGDLDGDGQPGESDEYIELYNPGALPVSLAGWQLFDSRSVREGGRRYTFDGGAVIAGQSVLVVWRAESGIVLNNSADRVYLFLPGGGEADEVGWDEWPVRGLALARTGSGWQHAQPPTPGQTSSASAGPAIAAAAVEPPPPIAVAAAAAVEPSPPIAVVVAAENGPSSEPPPLSVVDSSPPAAIVAPESDLGPMPTVAHTRRIGLSESTYVEGVVVVPPGLFNGSLYLADVSADGRTAATGLRVYLPLGDFPHLAEGDRVAVTGITRSFRGEKELRLEGPFAVGLLGRGTPLQPQAATLGAIGEMWEGHLVTVEGVVRLADGDSLYLGDTVEASASPLRVVVLRSLGWPRPHAAPGEVWRATGIVSQMARAAPWNGGYRLLVRYPHDLVRLAPVE